jgi:hypothetical protein
MIPSFAQLGPIERPFPLPPHAGPELASMRMDSLEQRVAILERARRTSAGPGPIPTHERMWLAIGLVVGVVCGAASVWVWMLAVRLVAHA